MSEWGWGFFSDEESILRGLSQEERAEVEAVARRLADAAEVKYPHEPPPEEAGSAPLKSIGEGPLMVWYQEQRTTHLIIIASVQRLPD
ncbi:hypothetical protein OEIGOIKO_05802 [Streptomyces chrestomyceticus JCM 4735]|uniref:Uncharacterized protein n=1 Tax=Streptomyces chrestomyceticus JCM 4735 TaxID=1306181 RepID=A0A7U9KYY1_9ACTN|nr:hypothetical protein [Streptomyces chrestomyceticus]GCD37992.1 hypothetical protein OEIGOIKO_05802 [Streptomyces chrestomyceticus JCM 4735]